MFKRLLVTLKSEFNADEAFYDVLKVPAVIQPLSDLDAEKMVPYIQPGDVVQLDPAQHTHAEGFWAANFMLVERVESWGVQGFCKAQGGDAYYRAKYGTFVKVGKAEWVPKSVAEKIEAQDGTKRSANYGTEDGDAD